MRPSSKTIIDVYIAQVLSDRKRMLRVRHINDLHLCSIGRQFGETGTDGKFGSGSHMWVS